VPRALGPDDEPPHWRWAGTATMPPLIDLDKMGWMLASATG
jgi:hypothetical protein